ncbi:MAG: serine/threonine-protein kinase [Cyanobacteria bacterium P01_G01_bin.39]
MMEGTVLGRRYRVIKYIAKGGFGKTFLAEDTQLPGRDKCVVKQLYPSVDNPNFIKIARRLFKTEAETLNTLGIHNQIPRLMAYFEEDEKFYLVQQYIEGHTLSQELNSGQPWSESRVIELLRDCLNILDFIHGQGVIHRDVKPDNLIRRQSDNKLVLVDFGTVKAIIAEQTQLVPATVAVGTRGYMPSEQSRGKPRTTSDIYALGIIATQALTGIHPTQFEESDKGELIWQDKVQCSPQLQSIVSKMTRYYFKDRYQSAQETIAALANLGSNFKAKPATPAVQYTPTVQLGDTELNAFRQPPATSSNSSSVSNDHSILVPPQNTGSNVTPLESTPSSANSQSAASLDQSTRVNNEPNSMGATPGSQASLEDAPLSKKSGKTLATLGIALAVGAVASGGMYFLSQKTTQSAQESIAEQINSFNAMLDNQDYQACYEKAVEIKNQGNDGSAVNAMPQEQRQEFEAKCGLAKAQQEAEDLKYGAAIAIATSLPEDTSVNAEIQQQIDSWSQQQLANANKLYEQEGNLDKALEMVKQIPQDSSVRSQVVDAKNFWKAESETNEAVITSAEKALSEEKWQYAKQQATKVKESSSSMYWQQQAQAIISQAEEGIGETAAAEVKPEPITPTQPKVIKPDTTTVTPPAIPREQPATRLKQDSSEPLRDLDGNSAPSNIPTDFSQNLRDL